MTLRTPARRWAGWALAFSFASVWLAGCRKPAQETPEAPEVVVTVQAAHPAVGSITQEITADAVLAPIAAAALSSRISAPIRAEYVQRGAHVQRGQVLVALEARDLEGSALDSAGAVNSAQANFTATTHSLIPEALKKAQLDALQLKAALEVAKRTARERESLYKQGALSGREADTAQAAAVQAQAAFEAAQQHATLLEQTTRLTDAEAAQGQLTSARGRRESAEAQVSYATLRSPINGVVTERPFFPGETPTAGTPVITVLDTSSLLAKLHLAQAAAQKLSVGHPATIAVPGMEQPVAASVSFISPALDPGSTTVEVWLKLPNGDGRLKVGTPVHAVIGGATVPNATQVPPSALVPAEDGGTDVVVIRPDGTTRKQAVTVGLRTGEAVQILSGVSQGDLVVTKGGYGLDDGTRVKLGDPGAPEDKD